jgi:two-component system, cell cycle response regulator DivK
MPMRCARKPVILVIEDYGDSREMMKLLLEDLGYRVLSAANGHGALALAASNHLDLILTDFGLPDMDGIRVVRSLRKLNTRLRHVPIIMLTALEGDEYYYAALRAGCTAFLTKPTDFETLQTMIGDLLDEKCDETEDTPNDVQFREA